MADRQPASQKGRNDRIAVMCALGAGMMLGMAYAAEPLYQAFCRVTGYGGTPQVASVAPDTVLERTMTVRFDANTAPGLAWAFKPVQRTQELPIGENGLAFYEVTNTSDRPLTGTATFNVTPMKAAIYFNKIECFCFTEQTVPPGKTVSMPVSYFIDPAIAGDSNVDEVTTVTLSYTFFPVDAPERQTAALEGMTKTAN